MKKVLLSLILVLVLGLTLVAPLVSLPPSASPVLAQDDDPYVCLEDLGPGSILTLSSRPIMWAGLFYLRVDGELHNGWCIDPDVPIDMGWCFNATLLDKPQETPWCEIGYIMTNYSPTSDNESAAIQLAIWKCVKGRAGIIATNPAEVETRALDIYDDAVGKCLTGAQRLLIIHPTEESGGEPIQETIILTTAVGGEVHPINRVGILAPWIGLALVLVGSIIWFALKRRSRQQEAA